jgi:hypothetical protein
MARLAEPKAIKLLILLVGAQGPGDPLIKSQQIVLICQTHFDISSVRSQIEMARKLENVETEIDSQCPPITPEGRRFHRQTEASSCLALALSSLSLPLLSFCLAIPRLQ